MAKKKSQKKKASQKHRSEMHKDELTYFLDHPDIHREECVGNGNAPGSLASAINWGGKGTAAPSSAAPSAAPASSSSSPSIAQQINFGGKFKK